MARTQEKRRIKIERKDAYKYKVSGGDWAEAWFDEDGNIVEESTYTEHYLKELRGTNGNSENRKKKKVTTDEPEKDGCLMKMVKAPFKYLGKALWWLTKQVLGILTLGMLSSLLNDKK